METRLLFSLEDNHNLCNVHLLRAWSDIVEAYTATEKFEGHFLDERDWLEKIGFLIDDAPFTIGLRLNEPDYDGDDWKLELFLRDRKPRDKNGFFFDAISPFEYFDRDQYDDTVIGISIFMTDLIINKNYPYRIGINLKNISKRIMNYNVCPSEVKQFIIPIPDINEVLKLLPNRRNKSFIINNG